MLINRTTSRQIEGSPMGRRAFTWADKAVKSKNRGSREAAIDTAAFKLKTALYVN